MSVLSASSRANIDFDQHDQELVKCVIVGDSGVGKTKLVCARATNARYKLQDLMQSHVPTVWAIDHYATDRQVLELSKSEIDGVNVSLRLWDTFGYHDKDRRFAYGRADVVILCFSVVRPASFKNAKSVWLKEIKKSCPTTPIVLVGCQVDLRYLYRDKKFQDMDKGPFFREIQEKQIVYPNDGRMFAESIGAPYYEVSVLSGYGVKDVFDNVIRAALVKKGSGKFWMSGLKRVQPPLLQEPHIPPEPSASPVYFPENFLLQNFADFYRNGAYYDVRLEVCDEIRLAHKLLLSSASSVLCSLLAEHDTNKDNQNGEIYAMDIDSVSSQPPPYASMLSMVPQQDKPSTIRFSSHVMTESIDALLQFIYVGEINVEECDMLVLHQLLDIAYSLDVLELYDSVSRLITGGVSTSAQCQLLKTDFLERRSENIFSMLQTGQHTDIVFCLENGQLDAHRLILTARCDFMKALLNDNFKESLSGTVRFPDVLTVTFKALLEILYTGAAPDLTPNQYVDTIELANRLCLHDIVQVLEHSCISKLVSLTQEGRDAVGLAVQILEPAQYFNAHQLSNWSLHFLSINYLNLFKRHYKDLCRLDEGNKNYLVQNRWPPLWYLKELDYYKKSLRANISQQLHFPPMKKQKSEQQGCLCFASRSRIVQERLGIES